MWELECLIWGCSPVGRAGLIDPKWQWDEVRLRWRWGGEAGMEWVVWLRWRGWQDVEYESGSGTGTGSGSRTGTGTTVSAAAVAAQLRHPHYHHQLRHPNHHCHLIIITSRSPISSSSISLILPVSRSIRLVTRSILEPYHDRPNYHYHYHFSVWPLIFFTLHILISPTRGSDN